MGQCSAIPCLSELGLELSSEEEEAIRRRRSDADGLALLGALRRFRELGSASPLVEEADGELWSAACDLVEALLSGVASHFPDAVERVQLGRPTEPAIHVSFRCALKGEFATRSRIGGELHLGQQVSFALRPAEHRGQGAAPFALRAHGLGMRPLGECVAMRARMLNDLGEENFTRQSVYRWWEDHMHEFPPEQSKMRRIYESFLGLKAAPLPRWAREKGIWGYINAVPEVYDAFELRRDPRAPGGISLSLVLGLASTPEEEAGQVLIRSFCQEVLRNDRVAAQRLAASSTNYIAMVHALPMGACGACPRKIAKLFTAAQTWGPGEDSWMRSDDTWLCVDSRDMLGRVVKEQGRILWRRWHQDRWIGPGGAIQTHSVMKAHVMQRTKVRDAKKVQGRIPVVILGGILLALIMKSMFPEQAFVWGH